MGHTSNEKTKLLSRVRRIRGQVEAIERAVEDKQSCSKVLQLIAATRGAMNGLMTEVIEDHIRFHIVDPTHEPNKNRAKGAEELIDVLRSYLK